MTRDLDDRLARRFARQDDAALEPRGTFAQVRERAERLERRGRRRRKLKLLAAVAVAALIALPAIAVSRPLARQLFGGPADPGVRDYIGRVLGSDRQFDDPPRYVAGVRTARGLVLLWAAHRREAICTGVEASFGDADTVRMRLAGRTNADDGITCSADARPLGPQNAGLDNGQGLGSVHVDYGQVPASVHAVRVTFEDGRAQTALAEHGWVIVAYGPATRRPGHRPILEQALDAHGRALATVHLDPWDYGGTEPSPPALDGPGSTLLATVETPAGTAALRLSAPGRGWQRQQCFGLVDAGVSHDVECAYPAAFDPRIPAAVTSDLFLYGPRVADVVTGIASTIDRAWLVDTSSAVRPAHIARFELALTPQTVILAAARGGSRALTGIVTSRHGSIVGALLLASGRGQVPGSATPPCFLTDNGHAPTTAACRALMTVVRRAGVLRR